MSRTFASAALAALLAAAATVAVAAPDDIAPGARVGADDATLRASLAEKGYEVRKIERDDGKIEAYAMKEGKRYEIYVDPKTGEIARVKEDD